MIDYKLVRELLNDMIIDAAPKLSIEYPTGCTKYSTWHGVINSTIESKAFND